MAHQMRVNNGTLMVMTGQEYGRTRHDRLYVLWTPDDGARAASLDRRHVEQLIDVLRAMSDRLP